MNKKPLKPLIFITTTCFFLAIFTILTQKNTPLEYDISELKNLTINDIESITLNSPKEKLRLYKNKDNVWYASGKFPFPADINILHKFVKDLKQLKLYNASEDNEINKKNLGIKAQKDYPKVQVFRKGQKNAFLKFEVGKTVTKDKKNIARYLYFPEEKKIFFGNKTFNYLSSNRTVWLEKIVPPIDRIQSFSLKKNDNLFWRITRANNQSAFEFNHPAEYSSINKQTTFHIVNIINKIRYLEVVPASKIITKQSKDKISFTIQSFDNYSYKFTEISETNNNTRVKVQIRDDIKGQDFLFNETGFIVKEWHFLVNKKLWNVIKNFSFI